MARCSWVLQKWWNTGSASPASVSINRTVYVVLGDVAALAPFGMESDLGARAVGRVLGAEDQFAHGSFIGIGFLSLGSIMDHLTAKVNPLGRIILVLWIKGLRQIGSPR